MSKLAKSPWRIAALLIAAPCAGNLVTIDRLLAGPTIDETRNCVDGGVPYKVGAHLCSSVDTVLICLRPNQSYGVHGIYVYAGKDKGGLRFEKAHWVDTSSARCDRKGKVYY